VVAILGRRQRTKATNSSTTLRRAGLVGRHARRGLCGRARDRYSAVVLRYGRKTGELVSRLKTADTTQIKVPGAVGRIGFQSFFSALRNLVGSSAPAGHDGHNGGPAVCPHSCSAPILWIRAAAWSDFGRRLRASARAAAAGYGLADASGLAAELMGRRFAPCRPSPTRASRSIDSREKLWGSAAYARPGGTFSTRRAGARLERRGDLFFLTHQASSLVLWCAAAGRERCFGRGAPPTAEERAEPFRCVWPYSRLMDLGQCMRDGRCEL